MDLNLNKEGVGTVREEKTIVTLTCDLCGEKVERFASASSSHGDAAILDIKEEIRYHGTFSHDICLKCSDVILKFLNKTFPDRRRGRRN